MKTDPTAARMRSGDLTPALLRRKQFLISNSPNHFSEKSNFYKSHIEIINEGILLTNQYRRPAGNLNRLHDKSASLFI